MEKCFMRNHFKRKKGNGRRPKRGQKSLDDTVLGCLRSFSLDMYPCVPVMAQVAALWDDLDDKTLTN